MIPLQEIDFHAAEKVFYKVHLVAPTGAAPFFAEVLVYDSEFVPPYQSNVTFRQGFQSAAAAFGHVLDWVKAHSVKHGYTVNRLDNPCNCEFLARDVQQKSVQTAGLSLQVQVNGK